MRIKVTELKPGMRFSGPVVYDGSNVLLEAGLPIQPKHIAFLKRHGIEEVEIQGSLVGEEKTSVKEVSERVSEAAKTAGVEQEYQKLKTQRQKFESLHRQGIEIMAQVFDDLWRSFPLPVTRVKSLAERYVKEIAFAPMAFLPLIYRDFPEKEYLIPHAVNVGILSIFLGIELRLEKEALYNLGLGALLHDVGMVKVPRYIFTKKTELTPDEFRLIKTHPIYGLKILQEAGLPPEVANVAFCHHEQWDGKGYPRGLKEEEIPYNARIVSICDAFEAMTKKRAYREKKSSYEAMRNVLASSINKFDPEILKVFKRVIGLFPVGSLVQLSDGCIGIVVESNPTSPIRPKVKLVLDKFGRKPEREKIIDLSQEESIFIKRPVLEEELGV